MAVVTSMKQPSIVHCGLFFFPVVLPALSLQTYFNPLKLAHEFPTFSKIIKKECSIFHPEIGIQGLLHPVLSYIY